MFADTEDDFSLAPNSSAKASTRLYVNTSPEHYVLEMDEPTGLEQLMWLAETSQIEEAWVFVATKDSQGQERYLWYEVGKKETDGSVIIDSDALEKVASLYGNKIQAVHHYHIHPKSPPPGITETIESWSLPSKEDWDDSEELTAPFRAASPSATFADLVVLTDGVWWLDRNGTASIDVTRESAKLLACKNAVLDPTIHPSTEMAELVEQARQGNDFGKSIPERARQAYLSCASGTSLQPKYYWEEQLASIPPIIRPNNEDE